jgi:hypothetical protein
MAGTDGFALAYGHGAPWSNGTPLERELVGG